MSSRTNFGFNLISDPLSTDLWLIFQSWADFKSALKKKVFDSRVLGKDLSDLETKFVTLLELTNYNYMGVSGACVSFPIFYKHLTLY